MSTFEKDHIIKRIIALLDGTATEEERAAIECWMTQSKEQRAFFLRIRNIYLVSGQRADFSRIDSDRALQRIIRRIDSRRFVKQSGGGGKHIIRRTLYRWSAVAAAVALAYWLGGSVGKSAEQGIPAAEQTYTLSVAPGSKSEVVLSDSTRVWLNSGSTLSYPVAFTGKRREVHLQGEAFFKVRSDKEHPFIVNTKHMQVTATGTQFCVSDFDGAAGNSVTLVEGKVDVALPNNKVLQLCHSKHVEFDNATDSCICSIDDLYKYYSWKDGKLVFRNDPLSKVVERISRCYGTPIELRGKELQSYRYRATFEEESLYDILKLLKLSAPIDYREVKRHQDADGTFTEAKIVIFPIRKQ